MGCSARTAQFKTNTVGAIHTINAFLPQLLKGPTKKILVVTSTMGSPHFAVKAKVEHATAYAISKAALNLAIAKYAASTKLREAGLTIIGVNPGFMKSHKFRKGLRRVGTFQGSS